MVVAVHIAMVVGIVITLVVVRQVDMIAEVIIIFYLKEIPLMIEGDAVIVTVVATCAGHTLGYL